jgi:hypothetical protein
MEPTKDPTDLPHDDVSLFLCKGIRIKEFVQELKLVVSVIKYYILAFKMYNY